MKEIKLTQGKVALVDDEDYEYLNGFKWQAHRSRKTFYATRTKKIDGKKVDIKMHRVILGLTDPKIEIDHKDCDGLNNQRNNLRSATLSQNSFNKSKYKNQLSIYKGVGWCSRDKKWISRIRMYGTQHYLGSFKIEEDAAKAYDKAAKSYFGEFANLNFK